MRIAIVPSSDLDSKDLRAKRFLPDPDLGESHRFLVIQDRDDVIWEWCCRCGALCLDGKYMFPGPYGKPRETKKARRCPADKRPTWRRGGDYHYYGGWTVIGPRDGVYRANGQEFKRLKDAKAFVEGGCRRSSLRKNR